MKPIVFISHIKEEAELAISIKELLAPHFLNLIDFFVSSDGESIAMGQKWLDLVSQKLKGCVVELVICSPISVKRPWINFEAGAGWIRDIPVVPLCHSGLSPSDLPTPLNLLQAAKMTEVSGLSLIIPVLANALGAAAPKIDFSDFIVKVSNFEDRYTFWSKCNEIFAKIAAVHKDIVPGLKNQRNVDLDLTEGQVIMLEGFAQFLKKHNLLEFSKSGKTMMNATGFFHRCSLQVLPGLITILNAPQFKI